MPDSIKRTITAYTSNKTGKWYRYYLGFFCMTIYWFNCKIYKKWENREKKERRIKTADIISS